MVKMIISGSHILSIFKELTYFFLCPPFAALCLSSQSDLCLASLGDASARYLATVSTATKMLPVSLPPCLHQKSPVPLCVRSLKPGEGRSVLTDDCWLSSFRFGCQTVSGLKHLQDFIPLRNSSL